MLLLLFKTGRQEVVTDEIQFQHLEHFIKFSKIFNFFNESLPSKINFFEDSHNPQLLEIKKKHKNYHHSLLLVWEVEGTAKIGCCALQ